MINCQCKGGGIPKTNKLGIIFDDSISFSDLETLLSSLGSERNFKFENYAIAYNCISSDFIERYGLVKDFDKFFQKLGNVGINFWIDPVDQVEITQDYTSGFYISLIDFITSRDCILIFIRNRELPEWYDSIFRYAKSKDKSCIYELAID